MISILSIVFFSLFACLTPSLFGLPLQQSKENNQIVGGDYSNIHSSTPSYSNGEPSVAAIVGLSFLTLSQHINDDPVGVCRSMEKKLNLHVENIEVCPWKYICDYQENRYPQYILQAECKRQHESTCDSDSPKQCTPIAAVVPVVVPVSIGVNDSLTLSGSGNGVDELPPSFPCRPSTPGCEQKEIAIAVGCRVL